MFRRTRLATTLALLLTGAPLATGQSPPVYQAEYLGAGSHVAAMNEAGTVVFRGTVAIYPRAFVAGPGQPASLLLMPIGLLSSTPTDINEAGLITGDVSPYSSTGIKAYPAVWAPDGVGGYQLANVLDLLPGDDRGTADALNDVGDVIGTSNYLGTLHTVLFTETGTVNLPGMASLPADAVNDQRTYLSGNQLVHLDTLTVETLPVPAGSSSVVGWAINDAGQVAGELIGACGSTVAVYTPGAGWQSISACGSGNTCFDINANGDVLMKLGGEPWVHLAGVGDYRVEDLIAEDTGHWAVASPFGIAMNDAGQLALVASNDTTGQSGVVLLTPEAGETCQTDLGYAGPGAMQISLCGGDLSSGTSADLALTGALPFSTAWLILGAIEQPVPFKGGTLVPVPWLALLPLPTDGAGEAGITRVPGGNGPFSAFLQAVQPDAAQPKGFALSNALRADFLP